MRGFRESGFSIGINDVTPADELKQKKELMVEQAYLKCDQLIDLYNRGNWKHSQVVMKSKHWRQRLGVVV